MMSFVATLEDCWGPVFYMPLKLLPSHERWQYAKEKITQNSVLRDYIFKENHAAFYELIVSLPDNDRESCCRLEWLPDSFFEKEGASRQAFFIKITRNIIFNINKSIFSTLSTSSLESFCYEWLGVDYLRTMISNIADLQLVMYHFRHDLARFYNWLGRDYLVELGKRALSPSGDVFMSWESLGFNHLEKNRLPFLKWLGKETALAYCLFEISQCASYSFRHRAGEFIRDFTDEEREEFRVLIGRDGIQRLLSLNIYSLTVNIFTILPEEEKIIALDFIPGVSGDSINKKSASIVQQGENADHRTQLAAVMPQSYVIDQLQQGKLPLRHAVPILEKEKTFASKKQLLLTFKKSIVAHAQQAGIVVQAFNENERVKVATLLEEIIPEKTFFIRISILDGLLSQHQSDYVSAYPPTDIEQLKEAVNVIHDHFDKLTLIKKFSDQNDCYGKLKSLVIDVVAEVVDKLEIEKTFTLWFF
jgi:hypothetical protein